MNCEDSRTYLPAYLDDELGIADNLRMQKHLEDCAHCRQAQEEQLALRSVLRDPSLYSHPTPDFAKRIQDVVRRMAKEEAGSRRSPWFEPFKAGLLGWVPAAAFAVIVAVLGTLLTINSLRASHQQLIASAALTAHIRSLQPGHLLDVPSSDRHTVKPWFQGRLDFSPPVPDLSELGWTLIGGRLDYMDGHAVAAVIYQRRMHNINVFLWPNRGAADDGIKGDDAQGYQVLHWNGADMTYWVVSDLNKTELMDFSRALRGH